MLTKVKAEVKVAEKDLTAAKEAAALATKEEGSPEDTLGAAPRAQIPSFAAATMAIATAVAI